jgi:hypothetical protein
MAARARAGRAEGPDKGDAGCRNEAGRDRQGAGPEQGPHFANRERALKGERGSVPPEGNLGFSPLSRRAN